jgi:hypothetical protein
MIILATDETRICTEAGKYSFVGWVEERNPTIPILCWVSLRSTQPTIMTKAGVR